MPNSKLSPQEARVRKLLVKKRDTPIKQLFAIARPTLAVLPEPRRMQQVVGSIICRMNYKLADDGLVVRTGKARNSYRLYNLT